LILLGSLAAIGLLGTINAAASTSSAQTDTAALPNGAGRDTLLRVCSTCHAPQVVAQQRLTAEGWKELVETMANNGAVATDAELAEVTAYLARTFPATEQPSATEAAPKAE
jgi:mono/diheme cytochrome c family protein